VTAERELVARPAIRSLSNDSHQLAYVAFLVDREMRIANQLGYP
jgi:hypothetical protein